MKNEILIVSSLIAAVTITVVNAEIDHTNRDHTAMMHGSQAMFQVGEVTLTETGTDQQAGHNMEKVSIDSDSKELDIDFQAMRDFLNRRLGK